MEFQSLPNGLSSGPKMFTEITKAIMNHLRKLSILISIYLDHTYLCTQTKEELLENIEITLNVLQNWGFTINTNKSVLIPTQQLEFLGFLIDTVAYTVQLLPKKRKKIILNRKRTKVREIARLIGLYVSTFPASDEAPLHYRHLERFKKFQLEHRT